MNIDLLLKNKISKKILLPLIMPASFLIALGIFSYVLYRDKYFTMYDLGVAYRSSYLFFDQHSLINYPYHFFVSGVLNQKFFYIPLSLTLFIYNSPITILLDQTFTIAIGGYALFHISRHFGLNVRLSILNQMIYFLYPATYGYLTHGGNFQVYFLGLFLCAYLFYLKNNKLMFGIFSILAAITNVLSPIYLLTFFAWMFTIKLLKKDISGRRTADKRSNLLRQETYFVIITLVIWVVLIFIEIFQNGAYLLSDNLQGRYVPVTSSANSGNGILGLFDTAFNSLGLNYRMKFSFFVDMLFPLLFTSLLSFSFPFIILYFISISYLNYPGFFSILQQYPYAVMPFIFIGWISFQSKIMRSVKLDNSKPVAHKNLKKIADVLKQRKKAIAYTITFLVLLSSITSFLIFSPFSIQNIAAGNLKQEVEYTPLEMELNHMYSLVPSNSTVFMQNDVPQLSGVAKIYMPDFKTYHNQTVDFAVFNPLKYNLITTPFNGFSEKWAYRFSTNSSYGVYASVYGAVLYKLGYIGQPIYYIPINTTIVHRITMNLEPNVTIPSDALSQIFSPKTNFNYSFLVKTTTILPQSTFKLLVESSTPSFSINKSMEIIKVNNYQNLYMLKGNITIPYFDEWAFYIIGHENSYNNITLISGNITETNPQ